MCACHAWIRAGASTCRETLLQTLYKPCKQLPYVRSVSLAPRFTCTGRSPRPQPQAGRSPVRHGPVPPHAHAKKTHYTYAALHPALSCACTRGVTLFTHADQHGPTATRENLSAQRSHLITVWPSTTQHDARSAARAVVGAARARPSVASLAEVHTRDPAAPSVRTHRIRGPAGSHVRGADPRAWDTPCDAGESSATRAGVPACPRRVARRRRCEAEGQRHGARGSRGFVMHMRRTLPQVHTTTQRRCPPRQHPHPDE